LRRADTANGMEAIEALQCAVYFGLRNETLIFGKNTPAALTRRSISA
jgi:hypothetical protein